jgi:hypothetical protein
VRSNDLSDFYKWIYRPNYPNLGDTFSRGVLVEADIDIVGDVNGACAPWDVFPSLPGCNCLTDLRHEASDWGGITEGIGRAGLQITIAKEQSLSIPGHDPYGFTGNGAQYFIGLVPYALRSGADDEIRIWNMASNDYVWKLRFTDGIGFGLVPEDGSANGAVDPLTGLPAPRDGVIQGKGSHLKLEVGVLPAGGDYEYWDIWITRPDGTRVHVDPTIAERAGGPSTGFGIDGHTLMVDTTPVTTTGYTYNQLMIGQGKTQQVFGIKFNSIKIRNDYGSEDAQTPENVTKLHLLRSSNMVGKLVKVTGKVCTNTFGTQWYWIEEEDRSSAITVQPAVGTGVPSAGQRVTVIGTVSTVAGATVLTGATFTVDSAGNPLNALGITGRTMSVGLDLDARFIRVAGRVSHHPTRTDAFYVDDGSAQVLVIIPAGQPRPSPDSFVAVNGNLLRGTETALMVSSPSAITPYTP